MSQDFVRDMTEGYRFNSDAVLLGAGMLDRQIVEGVKVSVPLSVLNRHGLIAGATGTGKTKSLQLIVEQLSHKGVPCIVLDVKGDLSGLAARGAEDARIMERQRKMGFQWSPEDNFAELLSISGEKGTRMRATVSEFGPVLLSRILGLNDTQESVLSLMFKYADDRGLLLLDLEDMKALLQHITGEGKAEVQQNFGAVSSSTVGIIFRKIIELEQQGAASFFGERSFEIGDFLRTDDQGRGVISILRVTDLQDRPKLFSTFMLQLLAEIYSGFEEVGDLEKPRLCFFMDEAHLIFDEASSTLINQLETMVKLIRSKGIGIFFITQSPVDIPDSILSQLGLKVQHALRAFTAKDRKAIRLAAENYPETDHYEISALITELGIGEALVTSLNERGIPTPLVHCMMQAPRSRMGILSAEEISSLVDNSRIASYYNEEINRESAAEMLRSRVDPASGDDVEKDREPERKEKSTLGEVLDNPIAREVGRTVARELTRGLLGVFGFGGRKSKW